LLIDCPDRLGIVAAIGDFLYRHNANILHADQHQDAQRNLFLMWVEWDLTGFRMDLEEFARLFEPLATKFEMRWRLERSDQLRRVALLVSRQDHCRSLAPRSSHLGVPAQDRGVRLRASRPASVGGGLCS